MDLSRIGTTTRNRLQDSQKQNSVVATVWIRGPSPKSYWAHIPGSVTQGRNTRRCPAAWAALRTATARRVVRSEPVKPIATSLSWATSARTLPRERSTSSSSLGKNSSIMLGRAAGRPGTSRPAARAAT